MMQKSCSVKNRFLLIPPTGMITIEQNAIKFQFATPVFSMATPVVPLIAKG